MDRWSKPGDYVALLAYVDRDAAAIEALTSVADDAIRDKKHVATCVGFGPRFLHSTGQTYKGGPNSGVVLQITADHPDDLAVPGEKYTFAYGVIAAQARGDFDVSGGTWAASVLRVHLGIGRGGRAERLWPRWLGQRSRFRDRNSVWVRAPHPHPGLGALRAPSSPAGEGEVTSGEI